jgi:hypothetical protein
MRLPGSGDILYRARFQKNLGPACAGRDLPVMRTLVASISSRPVPAAPGPARKAVVCPAPLAVPVRDPVSGYLTHFTSFGQRIGRQHPAGRASGGIQ